MKYRIFYDISQTWYQDVEAENEEEALELFETDNDKLSEPEYLECSDTIINIEIAENGD